MKLTNKQVVLDSLAQAEYLQTHVRNVEAAISDVRRMMRHEEINAGGLVQALVSLELTAWRNAALWGLTLDSAEQERLKSAVAARFLPAQASVTHWMCRDGVPPSQWLVAEEAEFRAMASKAFAPKAPE